jgi:hypothetical protein
MSPERLLRSASPALAMRDNRLVLFGLPCMAREIRWVEMSPRFKNPWMPGVIAGEIVTSLVTIVGSVVIGVTRPGLPSTGTIL